MTPLQRIAERLLCIDARSLGLFRILFGLTLIGDLLLRTDWFVAFYTNEGVLPNHHHLFQLRETGRVWSFYHSFSNDDEIRFAFLVTLAFYLFFTLGWYTRVFTVVSAVCLVSLSGRNILANGIGDSLAICLILFAMFLPLGARYSIDSLRRSLADRDEHGPRDLNDRASPVPPQARPSLAALGILLVVGIVPLAAALQQTGETWKSGNALYYALRTDRWISAWGEAVRHKASAGALAGWTKLFRICELAILPLALVPVARQWIRPFAMAALAIIGLTIVTCFNFGPFGWSLLAAVPLLAPTELWELAKPKNRPIRLFYDEDCGICLWLARLLKRLDQRHNVTFVGNGSIAELPEGVTAETANESMIAVDPDGNVHTDAAALAQVLRSLPGLAWLGRLIGLPGIHELVRWAYYKVARNRMAISQACGLGACGLTPPEVAPVKAADGANEPPATVWRRRVVFAVESVLVAGLFATVLVATQGTNDLPAWTGLARPPAPPPPLEGSQPQPPAPLPRWKQALSSAASWTRINAPWGLWAPDPPLRNEALVTEATLREGQTIDVANGHPPDLDMTQPPRHRLGFLWSTFSDNIRRDEFGAFRPEFRRYLMRGAVVADSANPWYKVWQTPIMPVPINSLKAYWVSAPIAAPGQAAEGEVQRTEIYETYLPTRPLPDFANPGRLPQLRHPLHQVR
jgi:predicted DCC family thiol-disulfide oxidoreductase YuxK